MPKLSKTSNAKVETYVTEFPNEFQRNPNNELYCFICCIVVNHDRRSTIIKHRETWKHSKFLKEKCSIQPQSFISTEFSNQNDYMSYVVKAFLSANIPIYKANNQDLKSLFAFLGRPLPSEKSIRARVGGMAEAEIQNVRNYISNEKIFVVIDESDINGRRFFNTLVGIISNPTKTFLMDCRICDTIVNHQYVVHLIDDVLKDFAVERSNFFLLLSDAARYMSAAGNVLKELYPSLLHVTCVSHLIHNCAEKIRGKYTNVDNLIARIKASIVKNNVRRNEFLGIGIPPVPVITRWGSWLKAAMYYADNLPQVRSIVNSFTGDGVLVQNAKKALADTDLNISLLEIKRDYSCLIELIEKSEKTTYSMMSAHHDLSNISFGHDSCEIGLYLKKRLNKNTDLATIATVVRDDISPSQYHMLQNCQSTTASVERSFSMLNKLLTKDRPFKDDNVHKYFIVYYNNAQFNNN